MRHNHHSTPRELRLISLCITVSQVGICVFVHPIDYYSSIWHENTSFLCSCSVLEFIATHKESFDEELSAGMRDVTTLCSPQPPLSRYGYTYLMLLMQEYRSEREDTHSSIYNNCFLQLLCLKHFVIFFNTLVIFIFLGTPESKPDKQSHCSP